MTATSGDRAVRNESTFREANEKLRAVRDELAGDDERTPFLCECEVETCTTMMLLAMGEYESARQSGECSLVAPAHEDRTLGGVLTRTDRYLLVRKTGRAGELARELDPRG